MADPVRVLPEPAPEAISYRPVSGLAIAALVIATGYAIVVAGVGIVALASGTPLFLGVGTLIIPAVSFLLAVIARRQIRTSEGTRSGLGLATWAWWLSILFGVGYGAVYGGTFLAVCLQANADVQRYFFDKIRADKIDEAFQFTLDPEDRAQAARREIMIARYGQAAAGKKSPLAQFRENEIVQFVRQGGSETQIKYLGPKADWEYKDKGYTVHQVYRITTPAGVLDVAIGVRSRESHEFKGRRWQLLFNQASTYVASRQKTPYGNKLEAYRQLAHLFGGLWMRKQKELDFAALFLDTRDPKDRERLYRQYQSNQLAAAVAVVGGVMNPAGEAMASMSLLPVEDSNVGCRLFMPGFAAFAPTDLIDAEEFEAPKKIKAIMLTRIQEAFLQPTTVGLRPQDDTGILERSETEPHHVLVYFNVEVAMFEPDNPGVPKYRGQAALVLESDQDPMVSEVFPQWRVVKLKLFSGGTQPSGMPGR